MNEERTQLLFLFCTCVRRVSGEKYDFLKKFYCNTFERTPRTTRFSSILDRTHETTSKVLDFAQNSGICEINHCIKLVQFVLHGCTGQQDTSSTRKNVQTLRRQRLVVLESVSLVADQKINLLRIILEKLDIHSERLV